MKLYGVRLAKLERREGPARVGGADQRRIEDVEFLIEEDDSKHLFMRDIARKKDKTERVPLDGGFQDRPVDAPSRGQAVQHEFASRGPLLSGFRDRIERDLGCDAHRNDRRPSATRADRRRANPYNV